MRRETRKVSEHVCDFCNRTNPTVVWNTRNNEGMTLYAVDPASGRAIETCKDSDGKWAACDGCHDAIVVWRDSKVKGSALRRFIRDLWTRGDWGIKFPKDTRTQKAIKEQQKAMFSRLLPMFEMFEPFVAWLEPGQEVTLTERDDEILIPPGHIPDGSSRGKRLV